MPWLGSTTSTVTLSSSVYNQTAWQNWANFATTVMPPLQPFTVAVSTTSATFQYVGGLSDAAERTWTGWQTTYHPAATFRLNYDPDVGLTPQERQERADRAQAAREEQSRRELERRHVAALANDRAMTLLLSMLDDDEAAYHLQHGEFRVRGSAGSLFIIEKRGVHGNIRKVDAHGCVLERWCVAPSMRSEGGTCPTPDGWLGQLLSLKYDEPGIEAKANKSYVRTCVHPDVPILQAAA